MLPKGSLDSLGMRNQVNKIIRFTGTTDGAGDFSVTHNISDYTKIASITATINWNAAEMRDVAAHGGTVYADSTSVYIGGGLGGNYATQTCYITVILI